MIVVEIIEHAGQGNQMFMYAAAYALARKTNQKVTILFSTDYKQSFDRPFVFDKFNLDYKYIEKIIRIDKYKNPLLAKIIRKFYRVKFKKFSKNNYVYYEDLNKSRTYTELPLGYKNYFLHGYFESYKYFDEFKVDIIQQYKTIFDLNEDTLKLINKISNEDSVAMHIRRGDFLTEGRSVSTDYYKKIMYSLIDQNITFYLATIDNKVINEFAKKDNICIIDTNDNNKDLCDWLALSRCKRHILSNSTYSWWASYVSNSKDVYIPTFEEYKYMQKNATEEEYEDFYERVNYGKN